MIYLDTSVAVALLVPEPRTADVQAWFAGLAEATIGSDWLLAEFASAIAIKQRRSELSDANATRSSTCWWRAACASFPSVGPRFARRHNYPSNTVTACVPPMPCTPLTSL